MIHFPPPRREPFRLDLVPMINIVFLLLIFFMLTSSALKGSKEVDLPQAQTSELQTQSNLLVLVTSQGQIEYEGAVVSLDELSILLEENLRARKEKIVEIKADKNVEFEFFGNVIDVSKKAGAVDFVLATQSPELPKNSP